MATKKQNRRYLVRRVRRMINRLTDLGSRTTGHKLYSRGYGAGVTSQKNTKIKLEDDL